MFLKLIENNPDIPDLFKVLRNAKVKGNYIKYKGFKAWFNDCYVIKDKRPIELILNEIEKLNYK